MAGWGAGKWGAMPWGGIAETISRYIKIVHIKATNYIKVFIKQKQGS